MNDITENQDTAVAAEPKKIKFCDKSADGMTVKFAFGNGQTLSLDLSTLSEEMQAELMIHGALQKIGDSYASAGGDFAFGMAQASKVITNLESGQWGAPRAAGEGKKSVGELATALSELQGVPVDQIALALEAATEEQRKAFRAHPAIKAKIAEIRAKKAAEALAKLSAEGKAVGLPILS